MEANELIVVYSDFFSEWKDTNSKESSSFCLGFSERKKKMRVHHNLWMLPLDLIVWVRLTDAFLKMLSVYMVPYT